MNLLDKICMKRQFT